MPLTRVHSVAAAITALVAARGGGIIAGGIIAGAAEPTAIGGSGTVGCRLGYAGGTDAVAALHGHVVAKEHLLELGFLIVGGGGLLVGPSASGRLGPAAALRHG